MKKIFLIIGLAAVMSNATSFTAEKHLDRIATALERIARALEDQNRYEPVSKKETPKKTYDSRVNGRSLKAVPTIDTECIDECMMEYPPARRTDCIETKCGGSNEKSSFY